MLTLEAVIDALDSTNEEYTLDEVALAVYGEADDMLEDDTLVALDDEIGEIDGCTSEEEDGGATLDFAARPKRKAGYKPKMVVRAGKKVWINKRDPNKKVFLSPKQKNALRKARLKANTGRAKLNRAKSSRIRKRFA